MSSPPEATAPTVLPHKFSKLQKEKLSYQNLSESTLEPLTIHPESSTGHSPGTSTTEGETSQKKKRKTATTTAAATPAGGRGKKGAKTIDSAEENPPPVDEQDKAAMHLLLHFREANSNNTSSNPDTTMNDSSTTTTGLMDVNNAAATAGFVNPMFPFPQYLATAGPLFGGPVTTNPLANLALLNYPTAFPPPPTSSSVLDPTGVLPTPTTALKRKFEESEGLDGNHHHSNSSNNHHHTQNAPPVRKDEVNILQFFEPRFYQVFHEYQKFLQEATATGTVTVTTTIRDHLLALCLDHMIPFCCWARENPAITQWIKQTLEDNADLRPEVRNGISMILMYCFSAAQAKLRKDCDMFIALQDTETGLGIVNKTSLKIYNDPYQYFNFIKSCITGLIDAGRIPENERINKPKKSKLQAQSTEELEAFQEIKKILIDKLQHGEGEYVREKVLQISNLWYRRQLIRLKRFTTALTLLQTPLDLSGHRIGGILMENGLPGEVDLSKIIAYSAAAPAMTVGGLPLNNATLGHHHMAETMNNNSNNNNNATDNGSEEDEEETESHRKSVPVEFVKSTSFRLQTQSTDTAGDIDQTRSVSTLDESTSINIGKEVSATIATAPAPAPPTTTTTTTTTNTAAVAATGSVGMIAPNGMPLLNVAAASSLPFFPYPFSPYPFIPSQTKAPMEATTTTTQQQQLASPNARVNYAVPVPAAPPSNSSTAGVTYPNLPYFSYYPFRAATTANTTANTTAVENPISTSAAAAAAQAMLSPSTPSNAPGASSSSSSTSTTNSMTAPPGASITAYRFDRISLKQWKINEMKIFNVQYFLYDYPGVFYLVNERYLPESERLNLQTFHAEGTGMISLMHEFMARDALITSWSKRDHPHLYNLLELWLASNQELSLLDLWYQSQSQQEFHQPPPIPPPANTTTNTNPTEGEEAGGGGRTPTPSTTTTPNPEPVSYGYYEVRNRGRSTSSANNSNLNDLPALGRGYLIYEQCLQIGIVIRKNETVGLMEDCWRMVYLSDLEEVAGGHSTFDSFLLAFFPQLKPIFAPAPPIASEEHQTVTENPSTDHPEESHHTHNASSSSSSNSNHKRANITPDQILIKYYSHHFDSCTIGPPPMEKDGAYQTLGLLTESTETMFSRFTPDYVFHDLILHYYL